MPSSALTVAAHPLIDASAAISSREMRRSEIGKFSTARWVWAPHRAQTGPSPGPSVSCSVRVSLMRGTYPRGRLRLRAATGGGDTVRRMELAYSDQLPIGPDETPYRLLGTEGLGTVETSVGR